MEDVLKAIQEKYGVSRADSRKIVDALVVIEKDKQAKPGAKRKTAKSSSESKGLLDNLTGGLGGQSGGDLLPLVGGLLGGQQGGGLGDMLGGILGGPEGRSDLLGIVTDLIGSQAGQTAGLAGIVGVLLMGQGNSDVMDTVNGLLGRSTPAQPDTRPPRAARTASDRVRRLGAAAKNKPLDIEHDDSASKKKK